MPALRTEYSKLLLYDPDKSRSIVHCYTSRPTPLEERTMGRLFLIVEIDEPDQRNQQLIEEIQQAITREYYGSDHFQVEIAFERALQKANEHLHGLVGEELASWLKNLNILIGVLKDTSLHFTAVGRMHAFLVHRQRIIDILDSSPGAQTEMPTPLKIFTNIVSGQLNLGDTLLFCTTSILDHLSQEKLKRLISDQTPADASRAVDTLLNEAEGASSFGAFIIRLSPDVEPTAEELSLREQTRSALPPQPQDSMQRLIAREQETNTLLHHSLWLNIGRIAKSGLASIQETFGRRPSGRPRPTPKTPETQETSGQQLPVRRLTPKPSTLSSAGSIGGVLMRGAGALLRGIGTGAYRGVRWLFGAFRKPQIRSSAHFLPHATNRNLSQGSKWLQNLTPSRRRLLLVALVLILVFAQSIVSLGNRRESQKETETYQTLLRTANEKLSAADAALLINNESGARKLLAEGEEALKGIPDSKGAPKNEAEALMKRIDEKLESIRHVVNISPETIVDLAGLEVGFAATSFVLRGDQAYTFNTRSSSVYRVDLAERKTDVLVDAPSLEKAIVGFAHGDGPLALLLADGSLQSVDATDGALASLPVNYENVDRNIVDVAFYNNRLYTLDPRNNQIFRHDRSGSAYGLGQSWVKETDLDLQNSISFAIDGALYILQSDGSIVKLSAGRRTEATFDPVDPPITKPKRLASAGDTTSVFVLDPGEQRIVEFSKEGNFIQQYRADAFGSAMDLEVENGTIYVLMPTQVMRFPVSSNTSS